MDIAQWWINATPEQRTHVLRDCGWRTARGVATRQARLWSYIEWDSLSSAARNVLTRKAQAGELGL